MNRKRPNTAVVRSDSKREDKANRTLHDPEFYEIVKIAKGAPYFHETK